MRTLKSGDDTIQQTTPEEKVQFKPDVPEEERYLIELRLRFRDIKGKTMWDRIVTEFEKKFGKKPDKAALQMKLSRAKQKWIVWSKRDVSPVLHRRVVPFKLNGSGGNADE